jgi:hypothetical protein
VQRLMDGNGWGADDALAFLSAQYPIHEKSASKHLRSSRFFIDWLRPETCDEVVLSSKKYVCPPNS